MDSAFLDQFPLPEVASQDLKRQNRIAQNLGDGVVDFAGHDKGVAYRFFKHLDYNKEKSKILGYEKFDEIECIEWLIDRKNRPTEQVRFLPEELLRFDRDGEAVGGIFLESYRRFKEGLSAPGLSLSKWGVLADPEVMTLASAGIFSVEQFAALPRSKVEGRYPLEIIEAFERAIQFVNGKTSRAESEVLAEKMRELAQANARLMAELEEVKSGLSKSKAKKKDENS